MHESKPTHQFTSATESREPVLDTARRNSLKIRMGFNKVYKLLQEIFPQIDARVLRAVAIEHNKDIDAAAEAVISEVIPFLSSLQRGKSSTEIIPSLSAATATATAFPVDISLAESSEVITPSLSTTNVTATAFPVDISLNKSSEEIIPPLSTETGTAPALPVDISVGRSSEGVGDDDETLNRPHENIMSVAGVQSVDVTVHEEKNIDDDSLKPLAIGFLGDSETDKKISLNEASENEKELPPDAIPYHTLPGPHDDNDADEQKAICSDEMMHCAKVVGELDESALNYTIPTVETSSSTFSPQHESTISSPMTQSTHKHLTEAVEELIHVAKNNKKALSFAMESVRSLMKEVELKEQAAERAKLETALVVKHALAKIEELKEMVRHAEEEKCVHAGEIYGEKAIQTTELKELHLRVLSLPDIRDESLSLLDEMHRSLGVRLAAAENEIAMAEREKEEKEKAAMKAIAEQEMALEMVREEMKMLKQLAEDNAKVHEFLVDRGRVVDALQGEIAVAYQDARLLMQKLDDNVPLRKLLSSSTVGSTTKLTSSVAPSTTTATDTIETDDGWEMFETPPVASSSSPETRIW